MKFFAGPCKVCTSASSMLPSSALASRQYRSKSYRNIWTSDVSDLLNEGGVSFWTILGCRVEFLRLFNVWTLWLRMSTLWLYLDCRGYSLKFDVLNVRFCCIQRELLVFEVGVFCCWFCHDIVKFEFCRCDTCSKTTKWRQNMSFFILLLTVIMLNNTSTTHFTKNLKSDFFNLNRPTGVPYLALRWPWGILWRLVMPGSAILPL